MKNPYICNEFRSKFGIFRSWTLESMFNIISAHIYGRFVLTSTNDSASFFLCSNDIHTVTFTSNRTKCIRYNIGRSLCAKKKINSQIICAILKILWKIKTSTNRLKWNIYRWSQHRSALYSVISVINY